MTMPSSSSTPVPAVPKFGTWGSSCMLRPTPCPTSVRTTLKSARSTTSCTAAPMSPVRLPGRAWVMPAASDRRVASMRSEATWPTSPTGIVRAESLTQPSSVTPQSMLTMSPSPST